MRATGGRLYQRGMTADAIERWIKRRLAAAVAAGTGEWSNSAESALGKPIYQVTDGPMTLALSELGFTYTGLTPKIECRYDQVEALQLAPLVEIMRLRGDLDRHLNIGVVMRGSSARLEMQWPFRVYTSVATVLQRIVTEVV